MNKDRFELSYEERSKEKELDDWLGKTVRSAKVIHYGSDDNLSIEFTDPVLGRL